MKNINLTFNFHKIKTLDDVIQKFYYEFFIQICLGSSYTEYINYAKLRSRGKLTRLCVDVFVAFSEFSDQN